MTWSRCELPGTPAAGRHPSCDRRDPLPPAARRPAGGLIFDAVRIRPLQTGEAVTALPGDLLATQPSIPWRQIARMRDHLARRYFDTAHAIVQATVDEDPPNLERAIQALHRSLPGEGLTGERWSDHPACTHPLLAAVARDVNDYTSDAGRARLAGLIPAVIGLVGDDLRIDARIALRCARTALPVVDAGRQRSMAVAVLACERALAGREGRPAGGLEEQSRRALAAVPHAARWARSFTREAIIPRDVFRRHAAPTTVHDAVKGIALAAVPQPDEMLHDLLAGTIDECAALAGRDAGPGPGGDPAKWVSACALTGTAGGACAGVLRPA